MRVIMPMAGFGQRFVEAGFTEVKPLIEVCGEPMVNWALRPVPATDDGWDLIPVCRTGSPFEILPNAVRLPGPTQGAACTVLAAAVGLSPDEPVAVINTDQTFTTDLLELHQQAMRSGWDGFILTFESTEPRWSYAATDKSGRVIEVAEKRAISSHATVGFYWFRRARDLVRACATLIADDDRTNGEFYLCPAYNKMLALGAWVQAVPVEGFASLGTPEDVLAFELARGFVRETSESIEPPGISDEQ